MEILRTKRTILRKFQLSDFEPLLAMMTDAEVMQLTGFKNPQSAERIQELLHKWINEDCGDLGVWAAEEISSGQFVGWFMLKDTGFKDPEIGFMIPRYLWGNGYASELSSKIIDLALSDFNKTRVIASTSVDNLPSIKVLEKIGMVRSEQIHENKNIIYFEKHV